MLLSSEFCNLQEKAHLDKAASATLPNVRDIAAKAALVWRAEAGLALKREQRHLAAAQAAPGMAEDDMSGPDPDEYVPRERSVAGAVGESQAYTAVPVADTISIDPLAPITS